MMKQLNWELKEGLQRFSQARSLEALQPNVFSKYVDVFMALPKINLVCHRIFFTATLGLNVD